MLNVFKARQYGLNRRGMIGDVSQMVSHIWSYNQGSLSGKSLEFKNECEEFLLSLAFDEYAPRLKRYGFKAEVCSRSFRCSNCHAMQNAGTLLIWISDGTMIGDPMWAIRESNCRFGGLDSGWCVKCVTRLVESAPHVKCASI